MLASLDAGQTILAPTAEHAAALFDCVERHHLAAGRKVWATPGIRDFGGWLRGCHDARQLADATTARCLTDVEERELWRVAILASDRSGEFLDPAGAARAARRARRATYDYSIPLSAIETYDSAEVHALLAWIRAFDERCRELGCITADELPATFTRSPQAVAWIDSPGWRPAARAWLQRHGQSLLLPTDLKPASVTIAQAPSPDGESAAAAEWARVNRLADSAFRAWICVPDLRARRSEWVDAFDAALAPQRFNLAGGDGVATYAVAGGVPLADHGPVKAALGLLADSNGPQSFERFSALLRSAELQASDREALTAALLDGALRRRAPSEATLAGWLSQAEDVARAQGVGPVAALTRLRASLGALDRLQGSRPLSAWIPSWISAFEWAPWSQRHRWSSAEYQSAERLRELLADLASADPIFGGLTRTAAERILAAAAVETTFQPQTGIPPIWISGQLTDPWLNYEGLWIAGAAEESWPPAADPMALLPVRLQREFGIVAASADSQLQFARDLQVRWRRRADRLVYSVANTGDFRASRPSPLLPAAQPPPEPAAEPRPHWRAMFDAAPVLETLLDDLAPPFDASEHTRGVATLRAQSRCPFRGFAETRLAAEALELPAPGFDDRERGNLVHAALEQIWSTLGSSSTLASIPPPELASLLHRSAAQALAVVGAQRDPGPRWRARELERLPALLGKWLDLERQRPPFEVERLEHGKTAARHAGLEFMVRIDRVDRLTDGARVLIDYKSGRAAPDWRGDRPDNPQLPIYALLRPQGLVAVAYGQVNAGECRFVAESERAGVFRPSARKTRLEGRHSLAELLQVWARRIEAVAAEFAAGQAQVAPTPQACQTCRLQGLCRVPSVLGDAVHERG